MGLEYTSELFRCLPNAPVLSVDVEHVSPEVMISVRSE